MTKRYLPTMSRLREEDSPGLVVFQRRDWVSHTIHLLETLHAIEEVIPKHLEEAYESAIAFLQRGLAQPPEETPEEFKQSYPD